MNAVRVERHGGPEVLRLQELPSPVPGPGEVLVNVEAAGVNFIDVYHRTGLYPNPLPFTPGLEGAGTVAALGDGASGLRVGDRVAWTNRLGSYAERVVAPAELLVPVPPGVETRPAAAVMLQGMTAHYLTESTFPLEEGDTCLVHAAAGGVGLLLVQMAKRRGARVLGTVSTEEKAHLAREAGADEVILYTRQDFEVEVKRMTGGKGVSVVYDSVGQATFDKSLSCLRPRGMLVLFGQSSGTVPPFNPSLLAAKGSLFLTRPVLFHYVADRDSLLRRAQAVLGAVASGELKVRIDHTFALADAAEAHRALEGRETTGKLLLIPGRKS
jgi:NADPH2:quinone reductase